MKRLIVAFPILFFVIFTGQVCAWEGRMAAMGNPYGLVSDASDFLTHPAMIAWGSGVEAFIHYGYIYTDVSDWDTDLDIEYEGLSLIRGDYDISGDRERHEMRVGTAFPVGPSRMGLFFSYNKEDGGYDSTFTEENMFPGGVDQKLRSDIEDYAVSVFFGVPLNSISLGAEAGVRYTSEENRTFQDSSMGSAVRNQITGQLYPSGISPYPSLHHYMIPFDSEYWESFLKANISLGQGPVRVAFTGKGSFILSGDNDYEYELNPTSMDLEGDVDGWSAGADLWVRFIIGNGLSLPFLAGVDYKRKERDGKGEFETTIPVDAAYEHNEEILKIEAGGGFEKEFGKGSRIATGIYYQYIDIDTDLRLELMPSGADDVFVDHGSVPDSDEHRVALKVAGEMKFSNSFALLLGAGGFFGWVDYDLASDVWNTSVTLSQERVKTDGTRWGVSVSLGGSIKADGVSIEPFITGAYSKWHLDGEGPIYFGPPNLHFSSEFEHDQQGYMVGGGVSLLFR